MGIGVSGHTGIVELHTNGFFPADFEPHAVILYFDVALGPTQCTAKGIGRCGNVVQQSNLTKIKTVDEVKAEQLVSECGCDEFDKLDLMDHAERSVPILDGLPGQSSLVEQWQNIYAVALGIPVCDAGEHATAEPRQIWRLPCSGCHR